MFKSIVRIIIPGLIFAALGFIFNWHFIYIIIAYCAGSGIGALALFTWMQIRDKR